MPLLGDPEKCFNAPFKFYSTFCFDLFMFIYLCNVPGIIPFFQMPATARMAVPMFLALLVWVVFNATGIKHQGLFGYFKNVLFPPGVPKALYILVTPIELISTLVVRPFSLAVRLFANMLAGHITLKVFAGFVVSMSAAGAVGVAGSILPLIMTVAMTGLEFLVAFLQAYVFAVLTCMYLNDAVHGGH